MSSDPNFARLERLFDEGLEQPPERRAEWLLAACPDDAELRERVARMFRAHETPGLLDRPLRATPRADIRARLEAALGDRYVIESTLGEGGMATVFRTIERKHDRPVVIKVLHPEISAAVGERRFLDEVAIAAKLSHPHILALIDSGSVDGLLYYVTPFVGGESVRDRLKREGKRPLAEAIGVLRSVADALAHAHAAGIVHRDLKPANVLVVEGHAYLLDFGVARLAGEAQSPETAPGHLVGTPGYMAPEQAAGRPVDARADIYAWGLLARELLTGEREPTTGLAVARPDAPRSLVTLVEASLALDPDERPQSARALVAALDTLESTRRPVRRWPVAAGVLLVLSLGVAWGWRSRIQPAFGSDTGPIAVMPLQNETADSSLVSWGRLAGDWVTQGLHEAGLLPVIPWPTMLITAEQQALEGGDPVAMIHRQTGATAVVTGSYYRVGDSLRFQASITDARNGRLIAAIPPVMVSRDSASAAIRELRDRLMGAVGLALDERIITATGMNPPTWEAYRIFDEGLRLFNNYKYEDASRLMESAWRRDTTFTPALIHAAVAAMNDGARPRADSLLVMIRARRSSLSQYHAALTEGFSAYIQGDRRRAMELLRRGSAVAPGSRAGYTLAYVLIQFNRAEEALAVLGSLDPDQGAMRGWPSYWNQRAAAAHLVGAHEEELTYARELRRRFPEQRSAWVAEARALAALGRGKSLDSLLQVAETLDPDVYWSQGGMRSIVVDEYLTHQTGDASAAARSAITWLEARLREKPGRRDHIEWLWSALVAAGDRGRAEALLDSVEQASPGRLWVRGNLARLAAMRGDAALAAARLGAPDSASPGEHLLYQARVAALLGQRDEAIGRLADALRVGVLGWHWRRDDTLRDFHAFAGDARFVRLITPIPFTP